MSDQAQDFILRTITIDPNSRLSLNEIVTHPLVSRKKEQKIIIEKNFNISPATGDSTRKYY